MLLRSLILLSCVVYTYGFLTRKYIRVDATLKCDGPLSTTVSLHDEDQFNDDVLTIRHLTDKKRFVLEGFERELGEFKPYVRFIGTCNDKPHLKTDMIPLKYIYVDQDAPITYEVEYDLN